MAILPPKFTAREMLVSKWRLRENRALKCRFWPQKPNAGENPHQNGPRGGAGAGTPGDGAPALRPQQGSVLGPGMWRWWWWWW